MFKTLMITAAVAALSTPALAGPDITAAGATATSVSGSTSGAVSTSQGGSAQGGSATSSVGDTIAAIGDTVARVGDLTSKSEAAVGQNSQSTAFHSIYKEAAAPAIAAPSTFAPGQPCGASISIAGSKRAGGGGLSIPLPTPGCGDLKTLGATTETAQAASNPKFWTDLALVHYWTSDKDRRKSYEMMVCGQLKGDACPLRK